MLRSRVLLFTLGAITVGLAGCSNPKKASKENFAKAIDRHYQHHRSCFDLMDTGNVNPDGNELSRNKYPIYFAAAQNPALVSALGLPTAQVDALVSAGLMKETDTTIAVKDFMGSTSKDVAVKAYDFTDLGKSVTADAKKASSTNFGDFPRFCYGTPTVSEIERFTDPTNAMGMTMSQVNYTYKLSDVAKWANNAALQTAFPRIKQELAGLVEAQTGLVLANDGWIDARDLR